MYLLPFLPRPQKPLPFPFLFLLILFSIYDGILAFLLFFSPFQIRSVLSPFYLSPFLLRRSSLSPTCCPFSLPLPLASEKVFPPLLSSLNRGRICLFFNMIRENRFLFFFGGADAAPLFSLSFPNFLYFPSSAEERLKPRLPGKARAWTFESIRGAPSSPFFFLPVTLFFFTLSKVPLN